jgi:hypothetical protein
MQEELMCSRFAVPSTENWESKQGVVSGPRDGSGRAGRTDEVPFCSAVQEGLMRCRFSVPSTENWESKQGVVIGPRDWSGSAGRTDEVPFFSAFY